MTIGECSVYSSLQVKFAAWPTSWRPPCADRLPLRVLKVRGHSHYVLAPKIIALKYRPVYYYYLYFLPSVV